MIFVLAAEELRAVSKRHFTPGLFIASENVKLLVLFMSYDIRYIWSIMGYGSPNFF